MSQEEDEEEAALNAAALNAATLNGAVLERLSGGSPNESPSDKTAPESDKPEESESNGKSETDEENTLKIDEGNDENPDSGQSHPNSLNPTLIENSVMQPIVPPAEKPIKKEKKTSRVVVSLPRFNVLFYG